MDQISWYTIMRPFGIPWPPGDISRQIPGPTNVPERVPRAIDNARRLARQDYLKRIIATAGRSGNARAKGAMTGSILCERQESKATA